MSQLVADTGLVWHRLEQPGLHHSDGAVWEDHENTQSCAIEALDPDPERSLDALPAKVGAAGG